MEFKEFSNTVTVIEPRSNRQWNKFKELFRYKDLLYFSVLRDITVLYKQSVLGIAWAIITPTVSMLLFTFIFGNLAQVPSDGVPYPIFSFCGLLPWTYFSAAINGATTSLISGRGIFTKVYFPRIIFPLTPILSKLLDFFISFAVLVVLMIYFKFLPNLNVFLVIIPFTTLLLTAMGTGIWLSTLALQYRDVRFAMTFFTQLLMYGAPVVFPASLILQKFGAIAYYLYGIYPMVGVIEGFRASFLAYNTFPWELELISLAAAILLFLSSVRYFTKVENKLADVS